MAKKTPSFRVSYEHVDFSERLTDVRSWIEKAEELMAAADILQREINLYWEEIINKEAKTFNSPKRPYVQGPYSMLVAFSFENYLKALLIHKNRASLKNRLLSKLPDYLRSHNLAELALKAGLSLSVQEEELLIRLSRFSIWAARYPIPTDPGNLVNVKQLSDNKTYLTAFLAPTDVVRIKAFEDRLRRSNNLS